MEISTQQTNIKFIWSVLFQPLSPIFHNGNPLHYHSPGPQLWKSKLQLRNSYQTSSLQSSIPFPPLSRSFVPDTSVVATWQHITCSQTGLVRLVPAFTTMNNSLHSCSTRDSHHQSKSIPIDLPSLLSSFRTFRGRYALSPAEIYPLCYWSSPSHLPTGLLPPSVTNEMNTLFSSSFSLSATLTLTTILF